MAVKPIPEGYHTVTPYMTVQGADTLIAFLKEAFGALESERLTGENGRIQHAEVRIGDSVVMMAQATEQWTAMPSAIYLYVDDTDATYRRALQAGATSVMEPADQFYGDRNAGVQDPVGNYWWIATRIEDVSSEELARRAAAQGKR